MKKFYLLVLLILAIAPMKTHAQYAEITNVSLRCGPSSCNFGGINSNKDKTPTSVTVYISATQEGVDIFERGEPKFIMEITARWEISSYLTENKQTVSSAMPKYTAAGNRPGFYVQFGIPDAETAHRLKERGVSIDDFYITTRRK